MRHLNELMFESKPQDGKVVIKELSDGMYKFVEVKHGNQYMVQVWKSDGKSKFPPKDFSYLGELLYFDIEDVKQYPNEWVEEQVKRLK